MTSHPGEIAHATAIPASVHTTRVAFFAATAALGGFLFGFDSAVVNGAVFGIQRSFDASSAGTGFAVASILIGCAVGALVAGRLADRLGRKPVMLITAVIFASTAVWSALAGSAAMFTVARFFSGIAVGAASVVSPAYTAEIPPPQIRGRLASLQQLGIVVGIFASLLSDHLLARTAGGASGALWGGLAAWRWMFLVEVLPSLVFGFATALIPESPRYLVAAKREARALAVMLLIDRSASESDIMSIRRTIEADRAPRFADLRSPQGRVLPIVWIGAALSMFQQFVGINSIFYYGDVLWQSVGFSSNDSLRNNVVTGVINVLATLVAIAFVDRAGRRPLLLWGSAGMGVTLAALVLAFSTASHVEGHLRALAPDGDHGAGVRESLRLRVRHVVGAGRVGPPRRDVPERDPRGGDGRGGVRAVDGELARHHITFPPIVAAAGPGAAYAMYLAFTLLSFWFVRRFVAETKGRPLEEA